MTSEGEAQRVESEISSTLLIETHVGWVLWQEMSLSICGLVVLEGYWIYCSLLLPQLAVCVVFSDVLCCWGLCLIRLHSAAACESTRQQCENCQLVCSLINEVVNSSHVLLLATTNGQHSDQIQQDVKKQKQKKNSCQITTGPCHVPPKPLMQTCEREVSQTAWTRRCSICLQPKDHPLKWQVWISSCSQVLFVYLFIL